METALKQGFGAHLGCAYSLTCRWWADAGGRGMKTHRGPAGQRRCAHRRCWQANSSPPNCAHLRKVALCNAWQKAGTLHMFAELKSENEEREMGIYGKRAEILYIEILTDVKNVTLTNQATGNRSIANSKTRLKIHKGTNKTQEKWTVAKIYW